eukprot:6207791-Pleurochrysis_carterae.AAC.1
MQVQEKLGDNCGSVKNQLMTAKISKFKKQKRAYPRARRRPSRHGNEHRRADRCGIVPSQRQLAQLLT